MDEKNNSSVLTVAQLNEYIKYIIDSNPKLGDVTVKGEISNFTNHYKTGHLYFSLKDKDSLIRAIMFKSSASKLKFLPENGMKIILHGRVSAYVRDGQYQLYADSMEPDGVGALYIAFEQMKKRLEAEGLFRAELKRPLPKIPTRIGIITSPTGAAVRDMINVTGRRFPFASLLIFPSLVQGDGAPEQLIEGLKYFNTAKNVDVIIIGRGGGSIEDLWAFNSEALARAVRASAIPVISAVGHETDFTICDFAADRRAPTPSAAAEIAVPDTFELKRKINNIIGRMELLIMQEIRQNRAALEQLSKNRVIAAPQNFVDDRRMALVSYVQRIDSAIKLIMSEKRARYGKNTSLLDAVNPLKIISRGYSVGFSESGEIIKSVDQVEVGENFSFRTSDGDISGKVLEKHKSISK